MERKPTPSQTPPPENRGREEPRREPPRDERVRHDVPGGTQRGQEQGFAGRTYDRDIGVSPPDEDIMTAAERPDPDEVFAPGEIAPTLGYSPQRMGVTPIRVPAITPGEDVASVEDDEPELHTEPFEGRIAGMDPDDADRELAAPTARNVSGGHGAAHHGLYTGPERRRRQEEWARWVREDRRRQPYTYGDRHTL
ncbi:MAG: hypothetical protein ACOZNI_06520 [Myxococcota bacterium]